PEVVARVCGQTLRKRVRVVGARLLELAEEAHEALDIRAALRVLDEVGVDPRLARRYRPMPRREQIFSGAADKCLCECIPEPLDVIVRIRGVRDPRGV